MIRGPTNSHNMNPERNKPEILNLKIQSLKLLCPNFSRNIPTTSHVHVILTSSGLLEFPKCIMHI